MNGILFAKFTNFHNPKFSPDDQNLLVKFIYDWIRKKLASTHYYKYLEITNLHISHRTAKYMAKLISQSCGELQPAVYLSRGDGAI